MISGFLECSLRGENTNSSMELLEGLGFEFEIRTKDTPEDYPSTLDMRDVPEFLATLKAKALFTELSHDEIVLCADTVVILNGKILGKPTDRWDAIEMISELSGKTHEVITGVFIGNKIAHTTFSDRTEVTFSRLTLAEIESYIDQCKPYDKAGSYGVQEWIGYAAVEKMNGSYTTVMGLPTHLVYKELKKHFDSAQ